YQQELKLAPDLPVAQADVARALSLTAKTPAQYQTAVERVEASLKTNVINPAPGYTLLGELHLKFGHYPEACKALEASLKADSTVPEVHYNLSRAYRLAGNIAAADRTMKHYQDMESHYRKTLRLQKELSEKPDDLKLHLELAHAWEYYKAWPLV